MARRLPDDPVKRRLCTPGCVCGRHSQQRVEKFQATMRGRKGSQKAAGESLTATGYRFLTMQYDHPLATSGSVVMDHRAVLYAKIGSGPHPCHWLDRYGCRKKSLAWGGLGGDSLCVDHLDNDRLNNDQGNLVPCCTGCNVRRGSQSLSDEVILKIRTRYVKGGVTQKQLAVEYGTSGATVCRIVNHKVFADLTQGGDSVG